MSHGDFMRMIDDATWIFLEEMAEKPCSGKGLMRSQQPQTQLPHRVAYIWWKLHYNRSKDGSTNEKDWSIGKQGDSSAVRSSKSDLCTKLL